MADSNRFVDSGRPTRIALSIRVGRLESLYRLGSADSADPNRYNGRLLLLGWLLLLHLGRLLLLGRLPLLLLGRLLLLVRLPLLGAAAAGVRVPSERGNLLIRSLARI